MTPDERKQEERRRAAGWLDQKWTGDRTCPICKVNSWTVTEVMELRPFEGGGLVVGGGVFPIFQVICNNCGHAYTFNALVGKVVVEEPSAPLSGS